MYPATDPDVFVKIGNEKLQAAVQHVRNTAPDLQIDTQVLIGQPEGALLDHLEELEDGVVVVVGNRGDSGLSELLIGSTAAKLATHAPCPVVVVRPAPEGLQASEEAGRVVVGKRQQPKRQSRSQRRPGRPSTPPTGPGSSGGPSDDNQEAS
jgi:hypothetical protein